MRRSAASGAPAGDAELGLESWTLIGPNLRPVGVVDDYLAWLTHNERSPNTIEAYAFDLKVFWSYLVERGLDWTSVGVMEIGEFAAWARQPAQRTAVLREEAARRSAKTVNRMLSAVVGFYEFHGRRGNDLAKQLVVETRSGWGGHRPFLAEIAPQRRHGRAVRLPQQEALPKTLTLEQVAAVIDAQPHLRDRFLFALLASTGMRIGQALALRHEDVIAWERRIRIQLRADDDRRARSKGGAQGSIPVAGELIRAVERLHARGVRRPRLRLRVREPVGRRDRPADDLPRRQMTLVRRTERKVGFRFNPHRSGTPTQRWPTATASSSR